MTGYKHSHKSELWLTENNDIRLLNNLQDTSAEQPGRMTNIQMSGQQKNKTRRSKLQINSNRSYKNLCRKEMAVRFSISGVAGSQKRYLT